MARADAVDEFQSLPDNRLAIRESLGVRSAKALDPSRIQIVLGLSVSKACARAESYRIVSFQDSRYAYGSFVKPTEASIRTEIEAKGPPGCPWTSFDRTLVTLTLPHPIKEDTPYFVIAQGSQGEPVTGARTAQGFTYGPPASSQPEALHLAVLGLRQVEPVGPALVKLEFGPNFSPEAASHTENYRLSVAGKPVRVVHSGRITKIDTYRTEGWPFSAIPMHEVFLELERPLADGETLDVDVAPAITAAANLASLTFHSKRSLSNSLKVNQIGYLTNSPVKLAYLGRWMGSFPEQKSESGRSPALAFATPPPFQVCRETDAATVFEGRSKLVHRSGEMTEGYYKIDHSGEDVYALDFSELRTPGRFFLSVPGVGRSLPFEIGDNVYQKAFQVQAYGVFAQRCGIELGLPCSPWRRIACHNRGLTATTQKYAESHDIKDLSKRIARRAVEPPPDPRLDRLDHDTSLVAHYRLDGDLRDATHHHRDLKPLAAPRFVADRLAFPGENQALGPAEAGDKNGATTAGIPGDTRNGYTLCAWFRKDENNDFHGTLFGFGTGQWNQPRMQVTAGWGVLAFSVGSVSSPTNYARINDDRWHHVALRVDPIATQPQQAELWVDGRSVATGPAGQGTAGDFFLAAIHGKGAAGALFDDVRLYARALSSAEIGCLATPRPGEVPVTIAAHGGHHDAGDYNPRSHLDVAQILMDTYEMAPRKFYDGQLDVPETHNGIPDILDEAFWALRLWKGLQDADGGVYHGTESAGDPNFIDTVELDATGDYAYAKDEAASYAFAGAMAQASRILRGLGRVQEAEDHLARARRAYLWAASPDGQRGPSLSIAAYDDAKAYAAAQLLRTTGEAPFHADFLTACVWSKNPEAELNVHQKYDQSLAAWAYVNCPQAAVDPKIQKACRQAILDRAEFFIKHCQTMAYGFIRHPMAPINWGTGAYENNLPVMFWAHQLTGDPRYAYWIVRTCDNTLGANPLNRSYIVGLGVRTVRAPLHNSRYSHLGEVVPGQQVEGPVQSGDGYRVTEVAYPPIRHDFAVLHTFVDCHFAINMDEGVVRSQANSMAAFGLLLQDHN